MAISFLEKYLHCPVCGKQARLFIDQKSVSEDKNESGIVSKVLPHGDHHLLLEIDNNFDIRNEKKIVLDESNWSTSDSNNNVILWFDLLEKTLDRPFIINIIDDPTSYVAIFSDIINYNLTDGNYFDFENNADVLNFSREYLKINISVYPINKNDNEIVDIFLFFNHTAQELKKLLDQGGQIGKNSLIVLLYPDEIELEYMKLQSIFGNKDIKIIKYRHSNKVSVMRTLLMLIEEVLE